MKKRRRAAGANDGYSQQYKDADGRGESWVDTGTQDELVVAAARHIRPPVDQAEVDLTEVVW